MKKVTAAFAVIAALALVAAGAARADTGTADTSMGAVALTTNAQQQAIGTVALNAPALNADYNIMPDGTTGAPFNIVDQAAWNNMMCLQIQSIDYPQGGPTVCPQDGTFQPTPSQLAQLEVATVACVGVKLTAVSTGPMPSWAGPNFPWACGQYTASLASGLIGDYTSMITTGTITAWPGQQCTWFQDYDPTTGNCQGSSQAVSGKGSPVTAQAPNLDVLVGRTAVFQVVTEYCSYLAPAGTDVTKNRSSLGNGTAADIGCAGMSSSATLNGAAQNSTRTLTSTGAYGHSYTAKVPLKITAKSIDCHVPRLKGRMLRRAKLLLKRAHCKASVRYVRGRASGRVKYQPLPAGTGRPRGYRVRLAVVR